MVWNGVSVDLGRLAGSGRNERPDLWFLPYWNVGRDSFHGADDFWGWRSCWLCRSYFKSTSLGNWDSSGRRLVLGVARESKVGIVLSTHPGYFIQE